MNTEWIYLALFGLMLIFCCYPMMRMMMRGSDNEEQPTGKHADGQAAGPQEISKT